jgi:hypothetical protein
MSRSLCNSAPELSEVACKRLARILYEPFGICFYGVALSGERRLLAIASITDYACKYSRGPRPVPGAGGIKPSRCIHASGWLCRKRRDGSPRDAVSLVEVRVVPCPTLVSVNKL